MKTQTHTQTYTPTKQRLQFFLVLLCQLPILIDPLLVHRIFIPLVEHDEEDDVVPEAGEAVHGGHLDDEGEDCVCVGVCVCVCLRERERT